MNECINDWVYSVVNELVLICSEWMYKWMGLVYYEVIGFNM